MQSSMTSATISLCEGLAAKGIATMHFRTGHVNLSVEELHSGFLNRLYTSRDFEAGLVNLMKERYEV